MCATETGSHCYDISRNAQQIEKSDPYFCGTLTGNNSNLSYLGTSFSGTQLITIQYRKSNEPFRCFSVSLPPDFQVVQREPQMVNGAYQLHLPYTGLPSEKNFMMDYENDYCIIFEKLQEEEFYFSIRYPLSVFQGFCIALSTMNKFSSE